MQIACKSKRFLQLPLTSTSSAPDIEMFIDQPTLDDALHEVFSVLLDRGANVQGTRGEMKEVTGVLMQIENPRSRLSTTETKGKIYSAIGELLWYLSGSNKLDQIVYYLKKYEEETEDGETIYGAYGPRIFLPRGTSQI
jgi:thymidylate synthase